MKKASTCLERFRAEEKKSSNYVHVHDLEVTVLSFLKNCHPIVFFRADTGRTTGKGKFEL
jgi:hypothetical protein